MVVIGEVTRKLLGNLFELQDLGAKELKGTKSTGAQAASCASAGRTVVQTSAVAIAAQGTVI
jgi:hypothetical protein